MTLYTIFIYKKNALYHLIYKHRNAINITDSRKKLKHYIIQFITECISRKRIKKKRDHEMKKLDQSWESRYPVTVYDTFNVKITEGFSVLRVSEHRFPICPKVCVFSTPALSCV